MIPIEDLTDVTLAIEDTDKDDEDASKLVATYPQPLLLQKSVFKILVIAVADLVKL